MKKTFIFLAVSVLVVWAAVTNHRGDSASVSTPSPEPEIPSISFPEVDVRPDEVRALYMTAAVAGSSKNVGQILGVIKSSKNVNAVVINVKDGDGTYLGEGMEQVVRRFREAGIYPIARVVVFQDNELARRKPELALRDHAGNLWTSGGRYHWVDPASREVWDGVVDTALGALTIGFKEINFDYIRFPSDGDMEDLVYPVYDEIRLKVSIIDEFFEYLADAVRAKRPDAVLSADLFADSFLRNTGLGVGQRAGDAAAHFDVVSPMIYPSHYYPDNFGFPNPAEHPYDVVFRTLEHGKTFLASSTSIIRPWIQDFDMGAVYDAAMVREEMRAIRDAGYGSTWMVWNPSNVYNPETFRD